MWLSIYLKNIRCNAYKIPDEVVLYLLPFTIFAEYRMRFGQSFKQV